MLCLIGQYSVGVAEPQPGVAFKLSINYLSSPMTVVGIRNLIYISLISFTLGVMAKNPCPSCHRSEGGLHARGGKSESREVSLASIHSAALSCNLCSFVQQLLARDVTTPKKDDISYESAKVQVDDDGRRFTGQWQGALVIEIYTPSKLHPPHIRRGCVGLTSEGSHTGSRPKLPTPNDIPAEMSCDLAAGIIND